MPKEKNLDDLKKESEVTEHIIPLKDLELKLQTNSISGLTTSEVKHRLEMYGYNRLTPPKRKSEIIKLLEEIFLGFFNILLLLGGLLCFVTYLIDYFVDKKPELDNIYLGVVLIIVVIVTGIVSYHQSRRSSQIMESFKKLVPQHAKVIRDGQTNEISADELVLGDVVLIKVGDRVPADLRIIECNGLKVDNSALTGESEPQSRLAESTNENPLESKNLAFFSTNIVDGAGKGIVIKTADDTIMGRIANLASGLDSGETPIARELTHFVHIITAVAITLGVTFFIISFILGHKWIDAIVFLISIIVANVPEGLLLTVTIALTLTAQRMASKNCLVKNLEAVETLGSTSIICSDKTGTLTQNRMTVAHVWFDQKVYGIDISTKETAPVAPSESGTWKLFGDIGCLCNKATFKPNQDDVPVMNRDCIGDGSETAILKCMEMYFKNVTKKRDTCTKLTEIPFNSTNKFQLSIHKMTKDSCKLVMKGAPEKIIELCTSYVVDGKTQPMSPDFLASFNDTYLLLGSMGERVLGFCDLELNTKQFPPNFSFNAENPNFPLTGLRFVGLIAMIDPPRAAVPLAVAKCRAAGIRIIMVTGDHPITAHAIAKSVGIISPNSFTKEEIEEFKKKDQLKDMDVQTDTAAVIHGSDLKNMTPDELSSILITHPEIVFARTSPQQKLIIVEACQKLNAIVAVTGDGVNDSPALKKADIGISMGIEGSDVTKQAADMILLDDNFASIVMGVEEGRIIFDNLKKTITYTLTSNIPEITPFIVYVCLSIPLPLGTITILLIDIGTDLFPAIALAFEDAESDIMKRKPRNPKTDKLVNARLLSMSYVILGVFQMAGAFLNYFLIYAENGFFYSNLLYLRKEWEDKDVNDLQDYYGQEWHFSQRKLLERTVQTSVFANIVTLQWGVLIITKTRRNSIVRQGMYNNWLNISMFFETILALFFSLCPQIDILFKTQPLMWHWWLTSLPITVAIIAFDEIRKLLIRKLPPGNIVERGTYY